MAVFFKEITTIFKKAPCILEEQDGFCQYPIDNQSLSFLQLEE